MRVLRWFFIVLFILGIVVVGYYAYISTRQARLLTQARRYLEKANHKIALVCLRRALGYNPNDLEACRLMAEVADKFASPAALLWRSRIVELAPKSVPDRLALAQTALIFRDYLTATNALEGVKKEAKTAADYHSVAGSVAAAMRQFASAESHFLEAARLQPTNPIPRLNLAVVKLQGTNEQALAEARVTLRSLSSNSIVRSQALRELVADSLRTGKSSGALAFSGALLQETNSLFSDLLLRLDVLRDSQSDDFQKTLAGIQKEAASDARKTYELVMWQAARRGPADALAWLQSLPPETRTNQPATLLLAQCRTALRDWAGLQSALAREHWAELDFVRHAYKSLALRGQRLISSASIEWDAAFKATGGRKENLVMLLRLAASWNWIGESEDLLWTITRNFPADKWAPIALSRNLLLEGRTRSLMALYAQQAKANPKDLSAKNNLAMTALLLNEPGLRPHDLASEVYHQAPTNASYASTYAFSLYLQEKTADGLKIIETLKPQQLREPGVAVCYSLLLQASGQSDRARSYLELATRARLLPEERKLLRPH